jgi:hypothetical protein
MSLFGDYYRAFSNQQCDEIIKASEHLASNAFLLLGRMPDMERTEVLARAHRLTEHLLDSVAGENPMVASLALLGALRTLEQFVRQQTDKLVKH